MTPAAGPTAVRARRATAIVAVLCATAIVAAVRPDVALARDDAGAGRGDDDAAARTWSTPLRGRFSAPDPRAPSTLGERGLALTQAGARRGLRSTDLTAQVSALVLVSLRRWRALVPEAERLLGAAPPVALEAAATVVELGPAPARARGRAALGRILGDGSWPEVQLAAATYLARDDDPAGLPVLGAALASPHEALRLQAALALDAFARFDGRRLAAAPTASTASTAPFSHLDLYQQLLDAPEPSPLVRRAVATSLARAPASPRRDALVQRLATDPDPLVRGAAAAAAISGSPTGKRSPARGTAPRD